MPREFASITPEEGGLRWKFVKNYWIGKFLWQSGLIRRLRNERYAAVIFIGNAYYLSSWIAAIYCKFFGVKVLMWGHGFLKVEHGIKGIIRRLFYSLADGFFIYSKHSIDLMKKHGLGQKRLYQINNSLDYENQLKIRERLLKSKSPYGEETGDTLKLVFIGRLTQQKRLDILLLAIRYVEDRGIPIKCYLIGDGEMLVHLKSMVNEYELNRSIYFYGASYNEAITAVFLFHADVCISPGEVGLTAMHSMVYGTPVITHSNVDRQMPEFESVIPGETGDFFKENDALDLAEKMLRWKREHSDRNWVRNQCYKMIDTNYTPDFQQSVFIDGITEILDEIRYIEKK